MIRLYFDPKGDNIFPQNGTVAPATLTINIFDEKESSEEINLTKRVKELERQLAEVLVFLKFNNYDYQYFVDNEGHRTQRLIIVYYVHAFIDIFICFGASSL